jgi:large subunit ribosomal protein L29
MKAKDLQNMSEKDLLERINEEKNMLVKMKFNHTIAGTENPMQLRSRRRDIARMLTVLNQHKNNTK